ncbi:MAG: PhoH family protein [Bacteroidetes bacterium]|nr:PhoH family protein [Bacteroidota bacterium]
MEKIIYIQDIDPRVLFGTNNHLFELLRKYFPKLKIMARGEEVKIQGPDEEIVLFQERFALLMALAQRKNILQETDILTLFGGESLGTEDWDDDQAIVFGNDGKSIRARTPNQQALAAAYAQNDLIFALGPAGTGKTYTAIALSVRALKNKEVKRIILTRPAVEAGERLGFLPGDLKEKLDPYLQPLYDALHDMIPGKRLQTYMEEGVIQIAPLAYMRGRTLDNACVILDEAQNTNLGQLKMFLTRMGCNAKFIVTGDATQIDLPRKSDSGLPEVEKMLKHTKGIAFIYFDDRDMVRHPLVKEIVKAFERFDE